MLSYILFSQAIYALSVDWRLALFTAYVLLAAWIVGALCCVLCGAREAR